jgi:hypothetical protein
MRVVVVVGLRVLGVCEGLVDDADGDLDAGGDGADGFPAFAAGEDGGTLVVVDHGAAGRLQAILGFADDVAAPVF